MTWLGRVIGVTLILTVVGALLAGIATAISALMTIGTWWSLAAALFLLGAVLTAVLEAP